MSQANMRQLTNIYNGLESAPMANYRQGIRRALKKREISISELARRAGMERGQLGNLLRKPKVGSSASTTISTLERLAAAIGCSVVEFFEDGRAASKPAHDCKKAMGLGFIEEWDEGYVEVLKAHQFIRDNDYALDVVSLIRTFLLAVARKRDNVPAPFTEARVRRLFQPR